MAIWYRESVLGVSIVGFKTPGVALTGIVRVADNRVDSAWCAEYGVLILFFEIQGCRIHNASLLESALSIYKQKDSVDCFYGR